MTVKHTCVIADRGLVCWSDAGEGGTILLVLHAQDDLWGPVVSGHDVRGHHEVGAGSPGQPEV